MKKSFIFLLGLSCLVLPSFKTHALNVQNQRVYMPGGRFVTLIESKPKQQDNLALQFGFNYALNPYEFGVSDTGDRVRGIVDHMFTFDFGVGYSVTDRFAFAVNVPFHLTNNIHSFANFDEETVVSLGDVSVAAVLNVLDPEQSSSGFGFAVAPFLTFPSGVESNFVGDATFTGGVMAITDVDLNGHYFNANLGFRFREEEDFLNLEVGQEVLYGLGYHHYLSQAYDLNGFLEGKGSIVVAGLEGNSSPFEIMAGVSKTWTRESPLTLKFGSGLGLGSGYGAPDFRAALQVSYDYLLPHVIHKKQTKTTMVETVETRLKELTIYYPTDGAKVDPFYDQKISEIARILNEHPSMAPLYIVSHTDDVADDAYNMRLSQERSEKAYQEILKYGINTDRVVWYGVGEAHPEYPNDSSVNKALNRRTIFTFAKPSYIGGGAATDAVSDDTAAVNPNDSYTEVLKKKKQNRTLKEGEYYEEESVVKKKPVKKEVVVEKKKVKPKRKTKKSATTDDELEERDLDQPKTEDGDAEADTGEFDEGF